MIKKLANSCSFKLSTDWRTQGGDRNDLPCGDAKIPGVMWPNGSICEKNMRRQARGRKDAGISHNSLLPRLGLFEGHKLIPKA